MAGVGAAFLDNATPAMTDLLRRGSAAEPETWTEALEILHSLIERIVLHPTKSGLEIELIGEIAAMTAPTANPRLPNSLGHRRHTALG